MPRKRKNLGIDELDIMAELDAMRRESGWRRREFTAEQDAALLAARAHPDKDPVPWRDFVEWWIARWGKVNVDTLRNRLHVLIEEMEQ